jgi:hypothetical protein
MGILPGQKSVKEVAAGGKLTATISNPVCRVDLNFPLCTLAPTFPTHSAVQRLQTICVRP